MTECRKRANGRTVLEVWARCPVSVDYAELSETFALLTSQPPGPGEAPLLRQASLKLMPKPLYLSCPCGFQGELGAGEYSVHMGICPECDRVVEMDTGLELVAMSYADIEPFGQA